MGGITLVAVITYFVTSSDSGSMVIDMLCSNGIAEPPIAQRIFWALSEGAVAFALLEAGGDDALTALQTASIAAGLPFCVIMIIMMIATWQMFQDMEKEDPEWQKKQNDAIEAAKLDQVKTREFGRRLFESADYTLTAALSPCMDAGKGLLNFMMATVAPCMMIGRTNSALGIESRGMIYSGIFFFGFIFLHIMETVERGFYTFGWMSYITFCVVAAGERGKVREKLAIEGDGFSDCCTVFWCYPCALIQVDDEAVELGAGDFEEPKKE